MFKCFKKKPQDDRGDGVNRDESEVVTDHETSYNLWIPWAEDVSKTEGIYMPTRGEFEMGYPKGIVNHFNAGWANSNKKWPDPFPMDNAFNGIDKDSRKYAIRCLKWGAGKGYNFLVMDTLGRIYQSTPLNKWGYHAGKSYWKGLGHSVSNQLIGIEVMNPGKLTKQGDKYYTWFNQEVPSVNVRTVSNGYKVSGHYCKFTIEQEISLKRLWHFLNNNQPPHTYKIFKPEYILGHDEVSPGRKNDPGGALSKPLRELVNQSFGREVR